MAKAIVYKEIKSEDSCKYDGVSMGEVMLRIDPRDVPTARMRDNIRVSQGGGETNVACGLAYTFGLRSAVLTALVDDPLGENIRNQMREAGVEAGRILRVANQYPGIAGKPYLLVKTTEARDDDCATGEVAESLVVPVGSDESELWGLDALSRNGPGGVPMRVGS